MTIFNDFEKLQVVAPNFKRRLSGVTSTIIQLVPVQNATGITIATIGPGLPNHLPKIRYRDLWKLWKKPNSGKNRIWHARRNTEMLAGVIMRDVLRMPVKLVFTSASQRQHTGYTKWLIRRMDGVIATSAKTAAYLKVPHQIIMHGIDTDRFSEVDDKSKLKAELGLPIAQKLIGCFGRIRHQKGTDLFIDTMISILPNAPDWSAIIAGNITSQHTAFANELKGRIHNSGLSDRIIFVGEHTDIHRWYQALDVFVAPQRWEGFGLTPLEAMACGVPVIGTDVGAFSSLLKDAPYSALTSETDMENDVFQLMTNIESANQEHAAIRRHVTDNFSLDKETANLNAFYQSIENFTYPYI
ncbi:glycosyltransferase family 4 protein [Ahrensia kielensis]|uniref:glycosyltransferase family 4 protein n=1 Tax=Ahrensia kielensis TaxID=76980 RepID=UPI0003740A86|nr:glycosyltransferase family 4 protein [Ahrensia kielensis]